MLKPKYDLKKSEVNSWLIQNCLPSLMRFSTPQGQEQSLSHLQFPQDTARKAGAWQMLAPSVAAPLPRQIEIDKFPSVRSQKKRPEKSINTYLETNQNRALFLSTPL